MRTFCYSVAFVLTVGAVYFLLRNHDRASADIVAYVARSKWEIGPGVLRGLAAQRADVIIAVSLLVLATMCQIAAGTAGLFARVHRHALVFLGALILSAGVLIASGVVAKRIANTTQARVADILSLPPATQVNWHVGAWAPRPGTPVRLLHEG